MCKKHCGEFIMSIIIGIIGLSFLVFFHELGHFIASRLCGVKVISFSIGMGPVLLHKTIKGTDYRLSLIPLGGYCGMKGEKDFIKALEENKKSIEGEPDSFYGVHPLKRMLISLAGPFNNLIFAVLAFFIIAMCGYSYYTADNTISLPEEYEELQNIPSPAKEAGILTGDKIIRMNSTEIKDSNDIFEFVSTHGDQDILITVQRMIDGNPAILEFNVHSNLDKETGSGKIGVVFSTDSITEKNYGPFGFFGAIKEGFIQTGKTIKLTFTSLGILFKGVKITSAVSGPAKITSMLGETVKSGFSSGFKNGLVSTLDLLALISISLFIMNLLPVPILDGGNVLFSLIEIITRKRINPKVLYYIQFAGIAFLGALFVIALLGDLSYFKGLFTKAP